MVDVSLVSRGGTALDGVAIPRGLPAASAPPELPAWIDAMGEIARAVNRLLPLDELLGLIATTTSRLTGYDFCAVLLEDAERGCLVIRGAYGLSPEYVAEINARSPILVRPCEQGDGPSSRAFRSQRPVALADVHDDPMTSPWEGLFAEEGYRGLLCLPLVAGHQPVGLLNCYTAEAHPFGPAEIILMETIANQAAVAIEATLLRERERSRMDELVRLNEELHEQRTVMQRAEEVHRELMRVLLDGDGLPDIAQALARILHCTVTVEDPGGTALAAAAPDGAPPLPRPDDADEAGVVLAVAERRTVELPPADEGEHAALVTPILLEGHVAGRLWAHRPEHGFTAFDHRCFERGALVLALAMLHTRTAQEVEWRLSRDVVDELLDTDGHPSDTLVERARQLGADLSRPHAVMVARPDPAPSPERGLRRVGGADHDGRAGRALLGAVQRCADRARRPALVAARGDHVVLLWPEAGEGDEPARFAESLHREIRAHADGWTASVAIGPSCRDVGEYADAYRLARGGLDLVQGSGRTGRTVSLDDLGVFRLLLQVKRPAELTAFARGVLGPLHDYDRRRETALAETLRAYLDAQCNAVDAAAALSVHVNTVAYRLRRVQELLQIDLHSPAALMQVEFAFMVERILGEPA
jgi:GAF domain-containing protein